MKRCVPHLAAFAIFAFHLSATYSSSDIPNIAAERSRLEHDRAVIETKHSVARAACYQQFEVNHCLSNAKRRQSEALAEIKRQERLLNADERKRKAFAQVNKLEERNGLANQEKAALETSRRANEQLDRQERSTGKNTGKPQADSSHKSDPKATGTVRAERVLPNELPNAKTRESAKNRAEFDRKQQEAAEHRADLDKRRRERTNPLAAPLPELPRNP